MEYLDRCHPRRKCPLILVDTLVLACCDPAVGLLAAALAAPAGIRLLPIQRPSHEALDLSSAGLCTSPAFI